MDFQIKFSKSATKFIKRLPPNIIERIKSKFDEISKNPFRYLEHYEVQDYAKIRIGNFRALVDVDKSNKILWVRVFDKRGRIYKR